MEPVVTTFSAPDLSSTLVVRGLQHKQLQLCFMHILGSLQSLGWTKCRHFCYTAMGKNESKILCIYIAVSNKGTLEASLHMFLCTKGLLGNK